ncbi:unnamed protein product, partial [Adineta steineri]
MQFIYHILLIIICVSIFVDCQGARGGGSLGRFIGGGAQYGGSLPKKSGSCDTHECRLAVTIFGIIFFIAGPSVWSSQYFQYETWHGPHQFPLLFNSQTMKIKGAGLDHVGIFSIKGFYSTKTNRIVLKKEYKSNTDHDIEKNSRQSVKI